MVRKYTEFLKLRLSDRITSFFCSFHFLMTKYLIIVNYSIYVNKNGDLVAVMSDSCKPLDCSHPVFSVHGISQASILECVAIAFSRGIFPTHGSNPCLLHCRQIIYHWATMEAQIVSSVTQSCLTICSPWIAACQTTLSIANPQSLFKSMSVELMMLSNHLILCRPPLLLLSIFSSIRVFSNESVFQNRRPNTVISASASALSMNIQDWFPLVWTGWISVQSKELSRAFSKTTVQKHQFFSAQLSL